MIFSSIPFIVYFLPVVLVVYYLLFFSRTLQNIWLLISSLFFYAYGEPVYVFVMIASILFNSLMAIIIDRVNGAKKKRVLLVLVIAANTGLLFFFKYLGFVLGLFFDGNSAVDWISNISLPIGISFFTFQSMSYCIDVYRKRVKADNPFYVGLYIAFFPQLITGPIVQFNKVADQLRNRKTTFDSFSSGICRFAAGLGKKVILANSYAAIADHVFAWSEIGTDKLAVPAALSWLGSICYSLQIYYDFSAYSDMAIGLALCFGFEIGENFNYPYIASSVTDFWRRWHISLTDWFREYVYIPLGGNRDANRDNMVRNMAVVWILTGIWHGANWTFIFWGGFYFAILLFERFVGLHKKSENSVSGRVYTLLVVNFLWVLFRAKDLYQAGRFYLNMFGLNNNGFLSSTALMLLKENIVVLAFGIILAAPVVPGMNRYLNRYERSGLNILYSLCYPVLMLLMVIVSISYLIIGSYNPFIYFNF